MQKYKVTYLRRFTANNKKEYYNVELCSVKPSKSAEDVYFGHRTYSVLVSVGKFPQDVIPDDYVKASVSFDKKSGKPFAYNFEKCTLEESVDAIETQFVDEVVGCIDGDF